MSDQTEKDIARFFRGHEASQELFNLLRKLIEKKRSPEIEVSGTQISFGETYKYLWVWLPQTWVKKRKDDSITLTIVTGEKIRNSRIAESVQPGKSSWTHHILIEKPEDIDAELEVLIQESIDFYLKRVASKRRKAGNGKHDL